MAKGEPEDVEHDDAWLLMPRCAVKILMASVRSPMRTPGVFEAKCL